MEINWRDIQILNGVILVELIIDTNGKVCCHALYNNSENPPEEILTLGLDFLFERMPSWQPAILNGKAVLSNLKVALYFNVIGHQRFDADYLRNDVAKVWHTKGNIDKKLIFDWDEIGKPLNKR